MADPWEWAAHTSGRFEGAMQQAFAAFVDDVQREAAAANGDVERMPWGRITARLERAWAESARDVTVVAGVREGDRLSVPSALINDNPYTAQWLRGHGAELVREVSSETREAIRNAIRRAVTTGVPPRDAARRLLDMRRIGLTTLQERAVQNAYDGWVAGKLSAEAAAKRAQAYAEKLLRYRGELIARTETMSALNAGQMTAWMRARDVGLVSHRAEREWVATRGSDRTCPICLEFQGVRAPLDGPFVSRQGVRLWAPPSHPACRCAMGLVPPKKA